MSGLTGSLGSEAQTRRQMGPSPTDQYGPHLSVAEAPSPLTGAEHYNAGDLLLAAADRLVRATMQGGEEGFEAQAATA